MIIAYAITLMIGKRDANAIKPKPSSNGDLLGTFVAIPMPKAVNSGTVTVDVVTPPESNASGMIILGAKQVWIKRKP